MEEKKILDRFERQCSRMEYCSGDIMRKALKATEGDREMAERIVSSLVKDRFVDDRRYAGAFAREKSSLQGWGEVKIRFQLRSKGISDEIISEALGEIDSEKAESKLLRLIRDKDKTVGSVPDRKLKLLRFALGRGYNYTEAARAVDTIIKETTDR